ncbi:MAG: GAF domain-containing protein [Candidatus Nanopelagicales bacterium]
MARSERPLTESLVGLAISTQGRKPSFWISVVSVLAAGGGAVLMTLGLDASTAPNWWLAGPGVALALLAILLQVLKEWGAYLRTELDKEADTGTIITIKNALHPVVEAVAILTQAQDPADKPKFLQRIADHICQALLLMFNEITEVRAVLYRQEGSALKPVTYAGRGRTPRDFKATDPRGRKALAMVRKRDHVYVPDIDDANPDLYGGTGSGYRCFISVSVQTPEKTYGMLTVDTPELDAFDPVVDVETVKLLADLAAVAMAIEELDH